MNFIIHPMIYLVLLSIDIFLTFQFSHVLTKLRFDKLKKYVAIVSVIIIIFLLDLYVFKMTKTAMRTFILMGLLFVAIKLSSKATWVQALLQIFILFAGLIVIDMTTMLVLNIMSHKLYELMEHFERIYALYILLLSVAVIVCSRFEIKIFRVERLKI